MSSAPSQLTPERLMQFAWGYAPPLMIEAGIRHGIFDVLQAGPQSLETVVTRTGASARGLRTLMNALVGLGLLAQQDHAYALTPESEALLVSTAPGFQGGLFKHISRQLLPNWLSLHEVVASGRPVSSVNAEGQGTEFFQQFVHDIFPLSYPAAKGLAAHLDLGSRNGEVRVLDVAAGSAVWSLALLQSAGNVVATAFDWEGVLPATRAMVERFGLTSRYSFVAGDLNQSSFEPESFDVATLGHILHSEGPESSQALLHKIYKALKPGGTIFIAEFLVNAERTAPAGSLIFAVNMTINTERGDTFSFEEIAGWLTAAGFQAPYQLQGPGPSPLILATR